MARSTSPNEPVTDEELERFQQAMRDQRSEIREDLAELTDRTPEEIEAAVAEYEMPDPGDLETVPADEFYDDEE